MNVLNIARRELMGYLTSTMMYVLTFVFLLITGIMHWGAVHYFAEYSAQAAMSGQFDYSFNDLLQGNYESWEVILTFMVPLLTMRLFAEERKGRTLELLLASPATTWDIVLGKFLAALTLFMLMIGMTAVYPAIMTSMTPIDFGPILTTYLGFLLLGAGFVSLGMFFSSITESQMIAAALSLGSLLGLFLISWFSSTASGGEMGFGVGYFSVMERMSAFTRGLIRSQDVVYWLSFSGVCLMATHQWVESLRYR